MNCRALTARSLVLLAVSAAGCGDREPRFEASPKLKDASLWVTVQRRFVWIDGCVGSARGRNEIETLLRGVPDMEMLIVNVMRAGDAAPPYRTLAPGQRRAD